MTAPIQIKTQAIHQDTFPGAYIEPKWSRVDAIKKIPIYAMRLLLGANVIKYPLGHQEYVQLNFDGFMYVLQIDNYHKCQAVVKTVQQHLLADNIFAVWTPEVSQRLRNMIDVVLKCYEFASDIAIQVYDIPLEKTKMLWIVPDLTACGYYRS